MGERGRREESGREVKGERTVEGEREVGKGRERKGGRESDTFVDRARDKVTGTESKTSKKQDTAEWPEPPLGK